MMKNDTTMTIRANSEVKKKAQTLFSDLGMDMSTAVNVFLHQAVRENRMPFEITREVTSAEGIDFLETETE